VDEITVLRGKVSEAGRELMKEITCAIMGVVEMIPYSSGRQQWERKNCLMIVSSSTIVNPE
jgi:hypothetical protein